MKHLKIKPTNTIHRDVDFLMKAPLLPNLYLAESRGYTLVLYKPTEGNEREPYILKTDNEDFLTSYRKYYEERFEVTDLESTKIPENYEILIGKENESSSSTSESPKETETE